MFYQLDCQTIIGSSQAGATATSHELTASSAVTATSRPLENDVCQFFKRLETSRRLLAGADTTRQLVNEPFVRAVQLQQGPASVVAKGWKPPRVKSCSMQLASEMRVAGLIDTYFEQPHPVLAPILLMTQVGCYGAVSISPYAGVSVQELRQTDWRCMGMPELTDTVKRMLVCVLEGSMALHELGLLVRDLKPDNIVFDADSRLFKLIDFGLAISQDTDDYFNGFTISYLDPIFFKPIKGIDEDGNACEVPVFLDGLDSCRQATQEAGPTMDIFLAALTAFVCLAGDDLPASVNPSARQLETIEDHQHYFAAWQELLANKWQLPALATLAGLPDGELAADFFDTALAINPADRFSSCDDALNHPWLQQTTQEVHHDMAQHMPVWAAKVAACRRWVDGEEALLLVQPAQQLAEQKPDPEEVQQQVATAVAGSVSCPSSGSSCTTAALPSAAKGSTCGSGSSSSPCNSISCCSGSMLAGSTLDLELVLVNSSTSQFSGGANGVQQPAVNAAPYHCGGSAAKQGYQATWHCGLLTATTGSTTNSSNSSSCSSWLPGWLPPWLGRNSEKAPAVSLRQCVGLAGLLEPQPAWKTWPAAAEQVLSRGCASSWASSMFVPPPVRVVDTSTPPARIG